MSITFLVYTPRDQPVRETMHYLTFLDILDDVYVKGESLSGSMKTAQDEHYLCTAITHLDERLHSDELFLVFDIKYTLGSFLAEAGSEAGTRSPACELVASEIDWYLHNGGGKVARMYKLTNSMVVVFEKGSEIIRDCMATLSRNKILREAKNA